MHWNIPSFEWRRHFLPLSVALVLTLQGLPQAFAQGKHQSDMSDADEKALADYHLTLEKLDRVDAVNKQVATSLQKDPLLKKELSGPGVLNTGKTLDDALGQFDSRAPRLAAILKSAGLTDRDYVLTMMSVVFASTGQEIKKYAPDEPLPPYIPADNVDLAGKNPARFQQVMEHMKSLQVRDKKADDESD